MSENSPLGSTDTKTTKVEVSSLVKPPLLSTETDD